MIENYYNNITKYWFSIRECLFVTTMESSTLTHQSSAVEKNNGSYGELRRL